MARTWRFGLSIFSGNADLSGDVSIVDPKGRGCIVPARDLLDFLGDRVGSDLIAKFKEADIGDVIRLIVAEKNPRNGPA